MREEIQKRQAKMEAEQLTMSPPADGPLHYVAKEVQDAMKNSKRLVA